ncbi:E3 ubiquitin-protein ligase TTC3 isoform X7 [Dermochelys coriacea]|uniref:E3 ubiquitin-protein ligase TTC3 isoform X7 n=1 Tax=Dermochelys coriacea TaxID=27794 RepID=UPI001CA9FD8F|nr:E3 ubiquitin-protein ligase TTC3 isoform X7 [Dermochelys coriacea]
MDSQLNGSFPLTLEACTMEVTTLIPLKSDSTFYGGCAKQCCELVHEKFRKRSSNKRKTVDPCEVWCSKPVHVLKDYCDVIKIYIVWPFLFKLENKPVVTDFSNSYFCELSLKRLWDIEVLEDIVDLAKKVVNNPFFIGGILSIGTRIENRVFDIGAALAWVKCTGEFNVLQKLEELGDYCWPPLEAFFAKYKHYITKVALEDCNLVEEFEAQSCENCIKKSEFMKKKGNCEFSQEKFAFAISSYTKAIEFCPENHLLYGNRALCFLLTGHYEKALVDGKRATILKPNWPKGHYRFCEALSLLGEHEWALEANERAQELCKNIPERVKDLILQNTKLRKEMDEIKGLKVSKHRRKKIFFEKKECGSSRSDLFSSQESKEMDKERRKIQADSKDHSCHQKENIRVTTDAISAKNKDWSSALSSGENHQNKGKLKNKTSDSEKTRDHLSLKTDSKNIQDKLCSAIQQVDLTVLPEMLKSLVHDGYTALTDQRCHSAKQFFSRLLNILDPSELKQLNLAVIDYVVVIYGHATALLGIGQPEELARAEDQFNTIIEQYHKERFNCLAHYGIGKVYLRQNRFSDAIHQFMKSHTMINRKIVPGILTWPTTSVVIEETRTEKLQLILENLIEECKFPPEPDAVCSYQQCHGHSKIQIYFTDPDFKGFIQITCCLQCKVEFHISCWKKLKTTIYSDKNDKDFLQDSCFTPDCRGLISKIVIFSSSGLVKCVFEQKIPKIKDPPRASVKQKCSSSRKLKIKEEKKLKRKRVREEALNSAKVSVEENKRENNTSKYDGHKGSVQRFLFASDRVLQHILQNIEQIKTGVHDTSKLLSELLSWWVISEEDYRVCSTSSSTSNEVMEQLISHLIQKKNRVNTRIFVHVLSELEEVDPKLHEWIKDLNSFGLEATKIFFSRYGDIVKELDLSFITFLWNEKYGSKLDSVLTSFEDNEILKCFYEASLKETRCVIWLLEDNREKFPSLHQALDEFFDKMDVPCIILKKQENEDIATNGIKVKNKNRKKKTKESRPILVLSGGVGAATREEDNIFPEENTLSFMNPGEPFIIPEYLRDQVEEFEALYDNVSDSNNYQRLLDNNPDPTCESLYEYFSQILEEHGPMEIDDKLLVGEYEHFPAEARKIVEDAGGLKPFLLESLHFVMMNDLIGLMKHAVLLKENTETEEDTRSEEENHIACQNIHGNSKSKLQLNPAAKEFKPVSYIKPYMPISTNTTVENCETPDYSVMGYSSHISYISMHSLPSQSIDTIEESLSFSNVLLHSSISDNHDIPLTKVSSGYENERTFSMISQLPPIPDVTGQPSYIYADSEAPLDIDKTIISDREYISGNHIPSQIQTYQDPQYVLVKSDYSSYEDNLDQGMSNIKEVKKYDISAVKMEFENKNIPVVKSIPLTRMIAIQVNQELADRDANTMPFYPFETQQGDILRMEKEHQVLQEQLKEAKEKYEQLQSRSSDETSVLEEQLKKRVEENKITQRELDWFHQDLEMEVKKWQQEKKENQEKLKATKNTSKKLADTNEIYLRNIDEKDKQYTVYLDKFLEISNKFANEKVQLEELNKKSKDNYQECIKRAVAAEVSVLENWKNTEVYKLQSIAANAEANLKLLKLIRSGSTSVLHQLKSQIDSWETFISNIKKEMEKVESQYEENIHLVKNGAQLNDLSKVKAADLQSPPSISVMHGSPPINDPAIIMYSSALVRPTLLPAFSSSKDQSPMHSTLDVQTGNKTACRSPNPCSAKNGSVEIPSETLGALYSDQVRIVQPLGISGSTAQNMQPNQRQLNDLASAMQLGAVRVSNKKALSKALDNIIERLMAIFPHYTSFDLTNFIEEVQIKNGNKLPGLSSDEILTRVTELILDHQNKKKAPTSAKRAEKPASCAVTQTLKVAKSAVGNVSSLSKVRPSYKTAANKTAQPSQPAHQPWRPVGGPSQSKWIKSNDSITSDDDPCIICHEELSQEDVCALECGHSFHRRCIGTWLKTQRTCPTCRVHVLLPEDFPKLPGRNRHT